MDLGGWIERLSGKVTTEEETDVYLDMTCHYRAEGSVMDSDVPDCFSIRYMSLVHDW